MAENMENQDSGLLVDLGVLSATGVAGTALFFRGASNPGFLNDMAIKANFALQEGRRLWDENRSGIERISISDISETWDRANQRFEDLKGHSINFKVQDTPELDRILNYYKYTLDNHDLLKTFYRNESARVGYQSLRSLGLNQGTALYATIHDAIQSYVARPGDLETIYNNLAGRLDLDQYKEAVDYLNYIVSDINNWQAENTFDNWKTGRGQHIVDQVRQQFNKTPLELLEEQNRRKQSLGNRFERLVFGSDNEVTIRELLDVLQNGTEAEKEEIRGYFDRGTEVALNTTEVLEKEGFDPKIIARASKEINSRGTTIFRGDEVLLHYYNNLSDKDKLIFGQLTVDDLRRTVDGRLYTTSDFKRTLLNISDEVASTAPASLLHFQDLTFQALNRQNFYISRMGDADFSTNEFFGHYTKDIEDWTYVSINGSFYEYNHDTGELIERTDLQGKGTIRSTNAGLARRVARTFNDAEVAPELDKSTLSGYLGLYAEHRPNTREFGNNAYLYGTFNDSNYRFIKQAVDTISNQTNRSEEEIYNARRVLAGLNRYTNFLTKYSFVDDLNSVRSLLDNLNASNPRLDRSIQALKAYIDLEENPQNIEHVINSLIRPASDNGLEHYNEQLGMTIRSYTKNSRAAMARLNTVADTYAMHSGGYRSISYRQILQQELLKEFFLGYEAEAGIGFKDLIEYINKNTSGSGRDSLLRLATTAEYFQRTGFPGIPSEDLDDIGETRFDTFVSRYRDILSYNDEDTVELRRALHDYLNVPFDRDYIVEGQDLRGWRRQNIAQSIIVKNIATAKYSGLDIIREINEGHYNRAFDMSVKNVYHYANQLFAGRGSGDFTMLSLFTGHPIRRLNDALNDIDGVAMLPGGIRSTFGGILRFGFSGDDASSSGSIAKNLLLKRVLPAYIGYQALDFIDDVMKVGTGTGMYEAGMNGIANIDLGIRKIFDATGITNGLKSLTQDNAVAEYFAGYFGDEDPEWKSYQERKHYYESGYNAIRKARFWDFGSSNEYRGGRISYWEPNTWRILESNYKMESLYNGSFWTKWNPFQLLDPYYLEHLHYEDRPYPVSGSLFADNTPWGIILNPTIGELYKPKRRMHQDRLDDSGVDVRTIIAHINEQVRNHARSNENLFYVERGRLRSMAFDAYNAPTPTERIVTVNNDGSIEANDYQTYNTALPVNSGIYNELVEADQEFRDPRLSISDRVAIMAAQGNPVAQVANMVSGSSLNIIQQNNEAIRNKTGYGKRQGIMREQKLGGYDPVEELLNNSDLIGELLETGSTNDYVQQMAISARMIGGIYGWMLSSTTGFGNNQFERIATSADMYSFSRRFWDSNMGGFGGELMEITRRVIPEYRRFQTHNPLRNTMPDWLPERFLYGDPYTAVPNGEMRLPGRGWESLNELHPDIYGTYGAFDRYKILADIAPFSPEYKFWKKVVQKTIKDPALKQEMDEINARVAEQSKQRDFQRYKYVGRGVNYQTGIITEILPYGQFKIFGSDEIYKLSGARVTANNGLSMQETLSKYLTPGMEVTLTIDENEAYARNNDANNTLNAGIIINGQSLADLMISNGDAVVRKGDTSASAYMTRHGSMVNTINWISEAIMHANIPVLHNRWLRANDALEDYLDEYVYGTSFQSWDDVMGTFIIPNMRIAASSTFWTAAGILSDIAVNNFSDGAFTEKNVIANLLRENIRWDQVQSKFPDAAEIRRVGLKWSQNINLFSDRGALMGKLIGTTLRLGQSEKDKFSRNLSRRLGSAATLAYGAYVAPENLAVSMMSLSRLGWLAGEYLETSKRKPLAVLGAALGAARWAFNINVLGEEDNFTYIPDSVKERWDVQEYFDRLTYLKYMGLYEKAADMAEEEEGVDIRRIIELQDREYSNIKEARREIEETLHNIGNPRNLREQALVDKLKEREKSLRPTQIALRGGEYSKSAIMYYNAARATMFGLDENSSMVDIIRALPKTEREYFMEFVQEKDPDKRKEILRYISPSLQKALRMMWYGEFEKPESMEDYFNSHVMPAPTWGGWNPNIDLADVMAKVVKNEGMTTSDFGIYNSEYRMPEVINAPELDYSSQPDNSIVTALKIKSVINGLGLWGVEVSVDPQEASTLDVIANIGRVVEYNIDQDIKDIFGGL